MQAGSPAAWRNPDGVFGRLACADWDACTFCTGDAPAPDQVFRLRGMIGGAVTLASTAGTPCRARRDTAGADYARYLPIN